MQQFLSHRPSPHLALVQKALQTKDPSGLSLESFLEALAWLRRYEDDVDGYAVYQWAKSLYPQNIDIGLYPVQQCIDEGEYAQAYKNLEDLDIPQTASKVLLTKAFLLVRLGKHGQAHAICKDITTAASPHNKHHIYREVAHIYRAMGAFPEALHCYCTLLCEPQVTLQDYQEYIEVMHAAGRLQDESDIVQACSLPTPEHISKQAVLAIAYAQIDYTKDALVLYQHAAAAYPHHQDILCRLAKYQLHHDDAPGAAATLEKALEHVVLQQAEVYTLLAEAYMYLAKYPQAQEACEAALARDPNQAETWSILARSLLLQSPQNQEYAMECHKEALLLQYSAPIYWHNLAQACIETKNIVMALVCYIEGIQRHNYAIELYIALTTVLATEASIAVAMTCLSCALQRMPMSWEASYYQAFLHIYTDNIAAAYPYLDNGLRINPDGYEGLLESLPWLADQRDRIRNIIQSYAQQGRD